ncbi:hypothetical protein TWF506_008756 [Arthrobotrys conoides]|uniref:Uncharacterized protein n=1 Tax=Arthrobotrys conoides TaxID=74498 RepID=A0AAN8NNH3_9PEZI
MMAYVIFIFSLGLIIGAGASDDSSASGWDDFANNFATDIAPIVVLFGEQVTKQFLSESTTILDHIIFAVAPLGVLTAVVSVIRVCGSSSLKAFIGRAQEAHGVSEAELCSSTSRDVCELWSNGGISRIFGRPKILEFVFSGREDFYIKFPARKDENGEPGKGPKDEGLEKERAGGEVIYPSCGIHKSKAFFCPGDFHDDGEPLKPDYWEEIDKTASTVEADQEAATRTQRFAPHPNLSLNVGIRPPPRWVQWIVVIFGVLLQLSFFGYATWASYYASDIWEDGKPPQKWAFPLAAIGTGLLVIGMGLCAMLIDRRTHERNFTKTKRGGSVEAGSPQASRTIMFWLQPGNQSVGDQVFNPFAYWECKDRYVTSWRADGSNQTTAVLTVWTAIIFSTLGFIFQFIGLRGLHGSVALYQIAATLIMAVIRAALRSKRIDEEKNRLKDRRKVEGHELDWIALQIDPAVAQEFKKNPTAAQSNKLNTNKSTQISTNKTDSSIAHETAINTPTDKENGTHTSTQQGSNGNGSNVHVQGSDISVLLSQENGGTDAQALVRETNSDIPPLGDHNTIAWTEVVANNSSRTRNDTNLTWRIVDLNPTRPLSTSPKARTTDFPEVKIVSSNSPTRQDIIGFLPKAGQSDKYSCARGAIKWIELNEKDQTDSRRPNEAARTLYYRQRLARLTDSITPEQERPWDTKVRIVAGRLKQAIESSVAHIFSGEMDILNEWKGAEALIWSSTCRLNVFEEESVDCIDYFPIHFLLYHDRERWTISRHQLEATLGLWQWSLESRLDSKKFNKKVLLVAEKTKKENPKSIIRLWISQALPIVEDDYSCPSIPEFEFQPILSVTALTASQIESQNAAALTPLPTEPASHTLLSTPRDPSSTSLLDLIAQDIYTMFINRISNLIEPLKDIETRTRGPQQGIINLGISRDKPFLGLSEPNIEILVANYIASGLGTREDALASVIPSLLYQKKLPVPEELCRQVARTAQSYRRSGDHQKCEDILKGLLQLQVPKIEALVVRGLGELYRSTIRSQKDQDQEFGRRVGVELKCMNCLSPEAKEIQQHYKEVIQYVDSVRNDPLKTLHSLDIRKDELWKALEDDLEHKNPSPLDLLLTMNYSISNSSEEQLSRVIKWAIENNSPELIEDLWKIAAPQSKSLWRGHPVSSAGNPLLWAVELECKWEAFQSVMEWPGIKIEERATNGRTALLEAVARNLTAHIQALLHYGADLNVQLPDGSNALHLATFEGNYEAVELLLNNGFDINAENKSKSFETTAVQIATSRGYLEIVELLLNRGVDINACDQALTVAAAQGHHELVKLLRSKGATIVTVDVLIDAVSKSFYEVVELLLRNGGDINTSGAVVSGGSETTAGLRTKSGANPNAQGGKYGNALNTAVYHQDGKMIELLLNHGADINGQTDRYGSALCFAAKTFGQLLDYSRRTVPRLPEPELTTINLLLKSGAEVTARGGKYGYALTAAVCKGNKDIVELLLKSGANVNAQGGKYGYALTAAARKGNMEAIEVLLKSGANVHAEGGEYGYAIIASAYYGVEEVAELLLASGADANAQGGVEHVTALTIALYAMDSEMIELLLKHGASANFQGGKYGNLLNIPIYYENVKMTKILLDAGADVNARAGEYGNALNTALAMKITNEKKNEMVDLLLAFGADVNAQGGRYGNALNTALYYCDIEMTRWLLDSGVDDVNAKGGEYGNALSTAVSGLGMSNKLEIVELLLKLGADVNAQDGIYGNVLNTAAVNTAALGFNASKIVQLLVKHGADIHARGGIYNNALQSAAFAGNLEVVEVLLSMNVDINAEGGKYGNALNAAAVRWNTRILWALIINGAEIVPELFPYEDEKIEIDERRGYLYEQIIKVMQKAQCERCRANDLRRCIASHEFCHLNWIYKAALEEKGLLPSANRQFIDE